MRSLLLLILFITSSSKTDEYYTSCIYGSPRNGFITYSDCQDYAEENSHCCLLYYQTSSGSNYNFFAEKIDSDNSNKEIHGRKLLNRWNFCFGLTNEGYKNIKKVIDELENESGLDDIHINCFSNYLSLNIIIFLFLILL